MKSGSLIIRRPAEEGRVMPHSGMAASAAQWAGRLRQIGADLETITDQAEDEFISIGTSFRNFYSRARTISEMSSDVASRMTGMEIVGAIDGLNSLMEKMEEYLKRSESETRLRIGRLTEVLGFMERVYEPLEDFHRITKSLRSLSITGMVQNALLISKNSAFGILLKDVRDLSMVMSAKSVTIDKNMRSLERLIEETISAFKAFEDRQLRKARTILDNTMNVLCSITGRYGVSKAAAVDIAGRSEAITQSTGDIVTSVQFHDITRQQFEHIGKALNHLYEYRHPVSGARFLPAGGSDEAVSAGLADFCQYQAEQLSLVRDTLVSAVNEVAGNLSRIAGNIADMAGDTEKIVGIGEEEKEAFLAGMEGTLSSVRVSFRALSENAAASRKLSSSVLSITGATEEMSKYIVDIEEIAEDIELIAFNAEVKSSQLGREGAAFVVVAASIQSLSAETCGQVQEVSDVLKRITSAAGSLVECIDEELEGSVKEIEDISGDLEVLMRTLSGLNRGIMTTFREIDQAALTLSGDIAALVRNINVHHLVDRVVGTAVSGLEALAADALQMFPEELKHLEGTHRLIAGEPGEGPGHFPEAGRLIGSSAHGTEGEIELF